MICEAIPNGAPCRHPAGYRVALEEEGPDETIVIATRDACADDLAAAVDWAFTRPTPYAGEAQDVYLTQHERRISVVSLSSDG